MKATPSETAPPPEPPPGPATESPAPAVPTPAPPPPSSWPEWFGAVDLALGIMVLVVAFLATSFAARNSDLFLNLATGRLLVEGNYTPGADPFSFSGEGRAWADPSWLFSLAVYALYTADPSGAALVATKAGLFALAIGALALLRQPGQALWPWVLAGALGIVAAAFYTPVRPAIISVVGMTLTLVLLFRLTWREDRWREPAILGGVFALWANLDPWFLLGPLTVALILIGERLNHFMTRGQDPDADADPFPKAPPRTALIRTLVIGVVACLLNPMVLAALVKSPGEAVAQLVPWELGFHTPAGASEDLDLAVMTFRPLTDDFYWFRPNTPDEQLKVNAVAYTILLFGGAGVLALGFSRLRATHIVLWVAFGALSLSHVRLIPVFAVVAIPLMAMYLNLLSRHARLTTWADTGTRILLGGSALGRVLSVVGCLILIGASYPGWLHPTQVDKSLVNKLDWAVEADAGLERSAKELHQLRSSQGLPPEQRGLGSSTALGDYCAWFAPTEKTFTNSRFAFHRTELPDLLTVRSVMVGRRNRGQTPATPTSDYADVAKVLENRGAGFLALVSSFQTIDAFHVFRLLQSDPRWMLWHLDGRAAFVARPTTADRTALSRFAYDPVRVALRPDVGSIPVDPMLMPLALPKDDWDLFLNSYLDRTKARSPDIDDVVVLGQYQRYLTDFANFQTQRRVMMARVGSALAGPTAGFVWTEFHANQPPEDARLFLPLLQVRAARKGVAANPDRPESYAALEQAYRDPFAPVLNSPIRYVGLSEKDLQILGAQMRYLGRIPNPDQANALQAQAAFQQLMRVSDTFGRTGQLDFELQMYKKILSYGKLLPAAAIWEMSPQAQAGQAPPAEDKMSELRTQLLKQLESQVDQLERRIDLTTDRLQKQNLKPAEKFAAAAQSGLPALALKMFKEVPIADFGEARDLVIIQAIILEFKSGQIEQAISHLNDLKDDIQQLMTRDPRSEKTQMFRALLEVRSRLEGNIPAVIESMNQVTLPSVEPEFIKLAIDPTLIGFATQAASKPYAFPMLAFTGGPAIAAAEIAGEIRGALLNEGAYHFDRAMLDYLDGNPAAARRRLEQAAKPQGVDLKQLGDPRAQYIERMLDIARRGAAQ